MILNPKIFRAYDIRGEAFVDFDEDGFFVTAQAFGQYISQKFFIKKPKIFVSGDGRLSMPQLHPAVIAGLEAANCSVTWGGTIPTPLNYFAFHEGGFDASIQISASHNPAQDNGLKLTDKKGAVCGEEIQKIQAMTQCIDCHGTNDFGECLKDCETIDFSKKYTKKLLSITSAQAPKKIVVDAGNGVSGSFYPYIFRAFGHEVVELFCDLDGNFPNHQPDPERIENLKDARKKVLETNSDFGFVFDGDGDRVGIVLHDNTILSADKILYVLATDFLSRNPNEKIIIDAMSSQILIEKLREIGGVPILSKTGHSYIEEAMKEHSALFGGEQSGHFMFGENFYGHDDAALACLRSLEAIENNPTLITEITKGWPKLFEFSEKITTADEEKFKILEKIKIALLEIFPKEKLNFIDGVRIDYDDGDWGIIRCSNTSPKISIRIEAKEKVLLETRKKMLISLLEAN
ncbi:phosphomannomutase/phosphoglucomutase [Candidatus Gracilibacteria bacterium]|nr:phosphomannomutase/phosphoglucomutase [Candidatus Gracilibacteria bacterium]